MSKQVLVTHLLLLALLTCCFTHAQAAPDVQQILSAYALNSAADRWSEVHIPHVTSLESLTALDATVRALSMAIVAVSSKSQGFLLSPTSPASKHWERPGIPCELNQDCLFRPLTERPPAASAAVTYAPWTALNETTFYLTGAGLLWQWNQPALRTFSGCWTAAQLLQRIMAPSAKLAALLEQHGGYRAAAEPNLACCTYSQATCEHLAAKLPGTTTLVHFRSLCHHSSFQALCQSQEWGHLSATARYAAAYSVCSRAGTVLGDPTHTTTKILLLLSFARRGQWPQWHGRPGQPPVWADADGFASCTSEEQYKELTAWQQHRQRYSGTPTDTVKSYSFGPLPSSSCTGCDCRTLAQPLLPRLAQRPALLPTAWAVPSVATNYTSSSSNSTTPAAAAAGGACGLDALHRQMKDPSAGPLCCGQGSPGGVAHLQAHPELQACQLLVLTYVGDKKNLLQQSAGRHPNVTVPAHTCYVAVMDPVSARFHLLDPGQPDKLKWRDTPASPSGLLQLGIFTVAVFVNSPYWNASDPHSSPRRNLHLFKLKSLQAFPNTRYIIWVDGKYILRQDPRIFASWALQPAAQYAIFDHPNHNCSYQELQLEKVLGQKDGALRSADHLTNLAVVERLYNATGMPRQWGMLDSAVNVKANTAEMQRFECLLWSLSHATTARDQLLVHYVMHTMGWVKGRQFAQHNSTCMKEVAAIYLGHLPPS